MMIHQFDETRDILMCDITMSLDQRRSSEASIRGVDQRRPLRDVQRNVSSWASTTEIYTSK